MKPIRFTPWMLKYPDESESGPHDHDEVARIIIERDDACWLRIRARSGDIWSPIHMHPGWEKYLPPEKRREQMIGSQPPLIVPPPPEVEPLMQAASAEEPATTPPDATAETLSPEETSPLAKPTAPSLHTVRAILDYNAQCEGQPLVKAPGRKSRAGWKPRTKWGEFCKACLFFSSLFFFFCMGLYMLASGLVFALSPWVLIQAAIEIFFFANPIFSVSFWSGIVLINLSVAWLVLVMGVHR